MTQINDEAGTPAEAAQAEGLEVPFAVPRRGSDMHGAADMLLTGHNRADAEDLLQTVLERAFRRWLVTGANHGCR